MKQLGSTSLVIVILTAAGCTGSIDPSGATRVELGQGAAVETYEFEALDPSKWTFTVFVTAPIGTVVEVSFMTTDGGTLLVFETPSDPGVSGCVEEPRGYLDCSTMFPLLPARQPGTWTASVHKLTEKPADVLVNVSWESELDSG
jgi:hypothetical protein